MSDYLQPGQHPDPDSLNAFIEGALPEHERLQCVEHLAECPACREVVYLAQEPLEAEPLPAPPPQKVPFWKRWLAPVPALGFAAAAGILVLSAWLYQQHLSAVKGPELAAMTPRSQQAREPLADSLRRRPSEGNNKRPDSAGRLYSNLCHWRFCGSLSHCRFCRLPHLQCPHQLRLLLPLRLLPRQWPGWPSRPNLPRLSR